jgi:5'-3' exonuclease
MRVHLVDGTYELFRHFFGAPPRQATDGLEVGAARGVVSSVVAMLEGGATHVGVATDHVIVSFRNELWLGYKTGEGVPPELAGQFGFLERALGALGVRVWPMVELEADDALASAAAVAAEDERVDQVLVCTPDKDLAQCVVGRRVVQLDRRAEHIIDEDGVWEKFGVGPASIPDFLALVGDSADGFPGLAGWGRKSAATVLAYYTSLSAIPDDVADWDPELKRSVRGAPKLAERLAADRALAELFLDLATLRVDRSLLSGVDELAWSGPTEEFAPLCAYMADRSLLGRVGALAARHGEGG